MISTGGTLVKAAEALIKRGATEVYCLATHGIFAGDAIKQFEASAIRKVIVTNTIPTSAHPDGIGTRIEQLSIAQILADAIKRITANRSVSELFAGDEFIETTTTTTITEEAPQHRIERRSGDRGCGLRNQRTPSWRNTERVTNVTIHQRAEIGTTGAKKARREGRIPGALYGHGAAEAIAVDAQYPQRIALQRRAKPHRRRDDRRQERVRAAA